MPRVWGSSELHYSPGENNLLSKFEDIYSAALIALQVVIASLRFHFQTRIHRKFPKHGVNALVEPGAHGSEASVVTTSPSLPPEKTNHSNATKGDVQSESYMTTK